MPANRSMTNATIPNLSGWTESTAWPNSSAQPTFSDGDLPDLGDVADWIIRERYEAAPSPGGALGAGEDPDIDPRHLDLVGEALEHWSRSHLDDLLSELLPEVGPHHLVDVTLTTE